MKDQDQSTISLKAQADHFLDIGRRKICGPEGRDRKHWLCMNMEGKGGILSLQNFTVSWVSKKMPSFFL